MRVRDRVVTHSDRNGLWGVCFSLFNPSTYVNGGDQLRIKVGDHARSIDIPRLEPRIDRVSNVIEGRADPGLEVDVAVSHRFDLKRTKDFVFNTHADSSGRYRVDTSGKFDLVGWDSVDILTQQGRDLFGASAVTPGIQIAVLSNDVLGFVNNGRDLTVQVKDRFGNSRGKVTAGPFAGGAFQIAMYDKQGRALYPRAHDVVTASFASDAHLEIPISQLHGLPNTDKVLGRCPPGASYQLVVRGKNFFGRADPQGKVTQDLSDKVDLKRGDQLTLYCQYPTGDIWEDIAVAL
jgi:hypothetical protein